MAEKRRKKSRRLACSCQVETLESRRLLTANSVFLDQFVALSDVGTYAFATGIDDFNGDGFADIVSGVTESGDYSATVLLGSGTGSFPIVQENPVDEFDFLRTADFNNDGLADLATFSDQPAADGEYFVSVHLSVGSGVFGVPQQFLLTGQPADAIVADFNGDGAMDLGVAILSADLSVLIGRGDGTFEPEETYRVGTQPVALTHNDFDADGVFDLAVTNIRSNDVSILIGRGDGTFESSQQIGAGSQPRSVLAGDLNGDGTQDLVVENAKDLTVLLGDGDGFFNHSLSIQEDVPATFLTDVDHDGVLDLVSSGQQAVFAVLRGVGDGTFETPKQYLNPQVSTVGDLNGDGNTDFAGHSAFGVSVVLAASNDQLGHRQYQTADPTEFWQGWSLPFMTPHDFNLDGITDLAVANSAEMAAEILLGRSEGGFEMGLVFPVGTEPGDIAVGDFNGDGQTDLATGHPSTSGVSVLFGKTDGYFQMEQTFATSGAVHNLVADDMNGDGLDDLVVATAPSEAATIFYGAPEGLVTLPQEVAIGRYTNLTAADVTGDGNSDLIATVANGRRVNSQVLLMSGNGDGTFGEPQEYSAGSNAGPVAVGDFNADGAIDLVTANSGASSLSLFLGEGNGKFAQQRTIDFPFTAFSGEGEPYSISVGDFNDDGVDDVAADMGHATLLFGSSSATPFAEQQRVISGVVPGDFDGDGVIDLAGHGIYVVYGESKIESPLIGDADQDGNVGFSDFLLLSANFGNVDAVFADGDFDGDGAVRFADFLLLSQNFGKTE